MLKIKKITRDKYETEFLKLKTDISDSTICTNLSIMAVLEKSFSYQVNVFGFFDNGRLVGILPTCKIGFKLVSLPHFSYGGFLCGPLYVNKCLTSFENFCYENSLDYEIRGFEKLSKYTYTDKVTAFLSLKPDSKEILSSFKSKLRSQIVKSYKNGLFCKVGSSSSLLKEFYLIYSKTC